MTPANTAIKTRFCPSPTGLIHLGNLRTAFFNLLLAKSYQAKQQAATFLLRIEDTDKARSEETYTQSLMSDLLWLGLSWQEGPNQHQGHEPYFQSQRVSIYQAYYQQLIQNQQAYWCFCSDAELSIHRKIQLQAGQPPRYPGTCRHLSAAQIAAKKASGQIPALRFRVSLSETVQFDDFIQGPKTFSTDDIGDFIIEKADGSASFMFCNAVDDALMGVTHVMRGEDHLTNTPRQLLILKALGLPVPLYGHMPLIFGFDGKPLSKRNGSQTIQSLAEQGYFPAAIHNYLARLGHHLDNEKLLSLDELGAQFSVEHIGRSPARFDLAQLNHWQKEALIQQSAEALWDWLKPYVKAWVSSEQATLFIDSIRQNVILPMDAVNWAKQLLSTDWEAEPEALAQLQDAGGVFLNGLEEAILCEGEVYPAVVKKLTEITHLKGKALFMPLRSVITGSTHGPELVKIFSLLGKEKLLQRVAEVKKRLG